MLNSHEAAPDSRRRRFLKTTAAFGSAAVLGAGSTAPAAARRRPRVAALFTEFTYRSHAHVILENFLGPYLFNGQKTDPGVDVVSFYADQLPTGDMSRKVAKRFKIPMFKSIREAMCVGGKTMAVDAVLSIAEHGNYPVNELGQREYPRKRFFDEIVAVMNEAKRFVPLFNDKHLSYRRDWAEEMYQTCRRLGIPLLAGSSVPLAQRRPPLDLPAGIELEEAVSIHGGPLESYDFHALEVLQSMIESRRGGETGVEQVEFLAGDEVLKAARQGRWSNQLVEAAMTAELGKRQKSLFRVDGEAETEPHAIRLTYRDGLKATVLRIGRSDMRWNFACRVKGKPGVSATAFYVGPWQNRNLFKALSHAIQHHFIHGEAPYPAERTLLVTAILDAAMHARKQPGRPVSLPGLDRSYQGRDFRAMREMGETWKIITPQTAQPRGLHRFGHP